MAYREVPRMEIGELIRRWQDGQRRIAASTGLSRNTVAKYLAASRNGKVIWQPHPVQGTTPSPEKILRRVWFQRSSTCHLSSKSSQSVDTGLRSAILRIPSHSSDRTGCTERRVLPRTSFISCREKVPLICSRVIGGTNF